MAIRIFFLAILMFLNSNAFSSVTSEDRNADRNAIRAHIDSVFDAYIRKDREALRKTHSENWRGFIRPSRDIIRGIDQYMREAEPLLASPSKIKAYQIVDLDVVFYGETAFVSYIADLDSEVGGYVFHSKLRVVDLYVKNDGHWNQAGSQVAPHPDTLEAASQNLRSLLPEEEKELLATREQVWRAWFGHNESVLDKVIPKEVIGINAGEESWNDRASIYSSSVELVSGGTKLVRLEFPITKIQVYGDVAILYSVYSYETESGGKRSAGSGRATEVFVHRNGVWVNTGWHLDSEKSRAFE
jgi:ketosteroid isomerase-like protein